MDRFGDTRFGIFAAVAAMIVALAMVAPASATIVDDRREGFHAVAALGGGLEIDIHFSTESTQYYDGIPPRNVGGKGGWDLYVEIRGPDGRRLESGGAGEREDAFTWTIDDLDSATAVGTISSWAYPDTEQEVPSTITLNLSLTGTGLAQPTLWPRRTVNPHVVEAGLGLTWEREASGHVVAQSEVLGTSEGDTTAATIHRRHDQTVSESVIDGDPEE